MTRTMASSVLLLMVMTACVTVHAVTERVSLESWNYAYYARSWAHIGSVTAMGLVEEHHESPLCQANVTFGFYGATTWVNGGCRGDFDVDIDTTDNMEQKCDQLTNEVKLQRQWLADLTSLVASVTEVTLEWGSWSTCSEACSGTQNRKRTCTDPLATFEGFEDRCPEDLVEERQCELCISLTGGNQPGEGVIQVTHQGKTRSMCDDDFDEDDLGATVVCRMLGYTHGIFASAYEFGFTSPDMWLDSVECDGTETHIKDCSMDDIGENDCSDDENAGVRCDSECVDNFTGMNCDVPITVVEWGPWSTCSGNCSVSGTQNRVGTCTIQGSGESCPEDSVEERECPNLCISLTGGNRRGEGAVQVTHKGETTFVCNDLFKDNDNGPTVVCRMLGYTNGTYEYGTTFTTGSGIMWLDNVECDGTEKHIEDCPMNTLGYDTCDQDDIAGVRCYSDCVGHFSGMNCDVPSTVVEWGPWSTCPGNCSVSGTQNRVGTCTILASGESCPENSVEERECPDLCISLTGGNQSGTEGAVQVTHKGETRFMCDDVFKNDDNGPTVVCRMLGFTNGTYVSGSSFGIESYDMWLDDVECDGTETQIRDCPMVDLGDHNCGKTENAGVRCT